MLRACFRIPAAALVALLWSGTTPAHASYTRLHFVPVDTSGTMTLQSGPTGALSGERVSWFG